MNELALFAGAGGGLLGSRLLGWRTVCAVEIDDYCQRVLLQRQRDGCLEKFPIWDDVRTFGGHEWRGRVDVVTAGFPCQPFSCAGKRRGAADERNMWPATARVLGEVRPRYALLENVPALVTSGYFGRVLGDLAALGFDARWGVFSAGTIGAHFAGGRLWIFAKDTAASCLRRKRSRKINQGPFAKNIWGESQFTGLVREELRLSVPAGSLGRVSDGVAHRVDRLRAIGNGQVPAVVARAWTRLTEREQA
ncbi:MAG: DNA cytosine methyltransferase [Planctomycetales bacterium]|nr:DNA cytosine methyltransferase [Planctomycetales bacterium]